MLIFEHGFPKRYQPNVRYAAEAIARRLDHPSNRLKLPRDLKEGLETVLDGIEVSPYPIASRSAMIAYDERAKGPFAYSGGPCVWLCKRAFDAGQDRVNAVLLHELVHVMCGWELDAEVFENLVFPGQGATRPDAGDIEVFAQKNWKGRWVRVVKRAGQELVIEDSRGGRILSLTDGPQNFLDNLTPSDLAGIPSA